MGHDGVPPVVTGLTQPRPVRVFRYRGIAIFLTTWSCLWPAARPLSFTLHRPSTL